MIAQLDKRRFGPWALITGASSGIGREFARQIAASGINVVLVARREALLKEAGAEFSKTYGVEHRIVVADLSEEGFMGKLVPATDGLDIGLVVSNAGTPNPGEFLKLDRNELARLLRLNTLAHLNIAHHFGQTLVKRHRGGILFSGAMGAVQGIPYVANECGGKSYIQSFGESLHAEWSPRGIHVTVLVIGPTQTAIIDKFGFKPADMPMKPMPVEQCVYEGLEALKRNRATHLSGRINRIMNALIPASLSRTMMGKMMAKALAARERNMATT
jgi:short-subunit dehydrogenase